MYDNNNLPNASALIAYDVDFARYPDWLLAFRGSVTVIIMVLGVLANLLTIVALTKYKKIRNVDTYFIISLSAADLLFCSIVMPFTAARYFRSNWVSVPFLCTMVPYLGYGNGSVSLFSVGMITVNRYIKIVHYRLHSVIYVYKSIILMIAFSWSVSYLIMLPTLIGVWGKFGYDPVFATCDIIVDVYGRTSKYALLLIAFITPCIMIVLCYASVLYVVHKSEKEMQRFSNGDVETKRKREELNRTKMVSVIFISFLICYLPEIIVDLVDETLQYPVPHMLSYILFNFSVFINPIIYVRMNSNYRSAYLKLLADLFAKCAFRSKVFRIQPTSYIEQL